MPATLTIRTATVHDDADLVRLGALDSAEPPAGRVLLAEVDGRVHAAVEVSTGRVVADPFEPTADLAQVLRLRAARLAVAAAPDRRLRSLLSRRARRSLSVT
jgi:hypothetical protein